MEKLGDAILEFAGSPEGLRFLEQQQHELVAPRNDPDYLSGLQQRDKDREAVANQVTHVHLARVWGRSRLGLTLRDDRNLATAREVATKLQGLLEAELIFSDDPNEEMNFADRLQKQPSKHQFGREKRSVAGEPKKRSPAKARGSK